jgi:hypothetical protein
LTSRHSVEAQALGEHTEADIEDGALKARRRLTQRLIQIVSFGLEHDMQQRLFRPQ